MMSSTKKLYFLILICLLALMPAGSAISNNQAEAGKDLVILFTHDLHSYFLPHGVLTEEGKQIRQGGYAKLACVADEQRRLHRNKTILVDAGDFSMGTLFHTSFMTEASELRLMGQMGYEVTTLGNHDFDFHPDGLAKMMKTALSRSKTLPAVVASNVVLSKNDPRDTPLKTAFQDYPVRDHVVIERNGLRIGIFGILGKDAAHDTPFARPVTFSDQIEAGKRMVDILKNKEHVDIILCLSHSGTFADKSKSEDEILARSVPQIDVIISGHTHTVLKKPVIIGKTIIVSCGSYSEYMGILGIRHEKQKGVTLTSYELKNISENICEDRKIASDISGYKKIVDREFLASHNLTYDEVIAESDYSMESLYSANIRPREMGLGNLITDAYRAAIRQAEGKDYRHVHFALQPLGLIRGSILKGKITTADIFQVLSLGIGPDRIAGYPLVSFYISGRELKDILEVHTTIAPLKKDDAYLQVSGIKFTYNPYRVWFDRVTSVQVEDEDGTFRPLDKNKLYRACANLYTAAMVDYVSTASHGLIKIHPKDESGHFLTNPKSAIVYINRSMELKEWLALTTYLGSFKDRNGINGPEIPPRYGQPEGRYLSQPSLNPVKIFGSPTAITCVFLLILSTGLLIVCLIIRAVMKKIKRKKISDG